MSSRKRDPEHEALVGRFLKKWEGVSGPKVEAAVPGVTQSDVSRWRNDDYFTLTDAKLQALRNDLEKGRDEEAREKLIAAAWMRRLADQLEEEAAKAVGAAASTSDVGSSVDAAEASRQAHRLADAGEGESRVQGE